MRDANWIVDGLNEEAAERAAPAVHDPVEYGEPRSGVITPEEFARMEAQMRAVAATDKPRSPWA